MNKIIIANWKMNLDVAQANALVAELNANLVLNESVVVAVAPQFLLIPEISTRLNLNKIKLAAQNCANEIKGAYTGESSVELLKHYGCEFCIVGHSERRNLYLEQDNLIAQKILLLLKYDIIPILCVGETLTERENNQYQQVISTQLTGAFSGLAPQQVAKIIIAYEPVWAIGTGQTATPAQADDVHSFIKQTLSKHYNKDVASAVPVIYGGSVKPTNAAELSLMPNIDGFLVGGASLLAEDFVSIVRSSK